MKKIRLSLRKDVPGPMDVIRIFPDVESVYTWYVDETSEVEHQIIDLEQDEFIEVEWLGCEFVWDGKKSIAMHIVRAVRAYVNSEQPEEVTIQPFHGWISPQELYFDTFESDKVSIVKIQNEDSKIDMNLVFKES